MRMYLFICFIISSLNSQTPCETIVMNCANNWNGFWNHHNSSNGVSTWRWNDANGLIFQQNFQWIFMDYVNHEFVLASELSQWQEIGPVGINTWHILRFQTNQIVSTVECSGKISCSNTLHPSSHPSRLPSSSFPSQFPSKFPSKISSSPSSVQAIWILYRVNITTPIQDSHQVQAVSNIIVSNFPSILDIRFTFSSTDVFILTTDPDFTFPPNFINALLSATMFPNPTSAPTAPIDMSVKLALSFDFLLSSYNINRLKILICNRLENCDSVDQISILNVQPHDDGVIVDISFNGTQSIGLTYEDRIYIQEVLHTEEKASISCDSSAEFGSLGAVFAGCFAAVSILLLLVLYRTWWFAGVPEKMFPRKHLPPPIRIEGEHGDSDSEGEDYYRHASFNNRGEGSPTSTRSPIKPPYSPSENLSPSRHSSIQMTPVKRRPDLQKFVSE